MKISYFYNGFVIERFNIREFEVNFMDLGLGFNRIGGIIKMRKSEFFGEIRFVQMQSIQWNT